MDRLTKNEFCLQIEVFQRITQLYLYLSIVNLQITEITVYTLSWQMLELGLKMRIFLNPAYSGLFENVFTFIPRWPEARDNDEDIP